MTPDEIAKWIEQNHAEIRHHGGLWEVTVVFGREGDGSPDTIQVRSLIFPMAIAAASRALEAAKSIHRYTK